ncbi:MAG: PfkB family carbohydrate kinase [Spirochaetia bacterium]|jgi:pseudouridine kinase|nr:PfkB family carbohydrate kinase [Spirochaetia bacterium]
MIDKYVALIGAANVDIQGFSTNQIINRDSNPGKIECCPGGVSRNIAENLSRLGIKTELISALGDDPNGSLIQESCRSCNIGTEYSIIVPGAVSSVYLAIMDNSRDMALALSDMTISDNINIEFLQGRDEVFKNSSAIVFDTCLSIEVMEYILNNYSDKPIYVDPVSVGKAKALKPLIGKVHTLKMNKLEAEFLSDTKIEGRSGLEKISEWFMNKGVKRVYITLGEDGVFYKDSKNLIIYKPNKTTIKNATGAGDAFMAGLVFGTLNGYNPGKIIHFATGVSMAALAGEETVNPKINFKYIEQITGELF